MTTTNTIVASKSTVAALLASLPKVAGSKEFDFAAFTAEQMEALKSKSPSIHAMARDVRGEGVITQVRAPTSAVSDGTLKALGLNRDTFNRLPKETREGLLASAPKVLEKAPKAPVDIAAVAEANGFTLVQFQGLPKAAQDSLIKASKLGAGFTGKPGVKLGVSKESGEATGTVQITTILFKGTIGLTPNNACRLAGAMVEAMALTEKHFDSLKQKDGQDSEALRARVKRINAALQSIKDELA